jgi:hypothetical protein
MDISELSDIDILKMFKSISFFEKNVSKAIGDDTNKKIIGIEKRKEELRILVKDTHDILKKLKNIFSSEKEVSNAIKDNVDKNIIGIETSDELIEKLKKIKKVIEDNPNASEEELNVLSKKALDNLFTDVLTEDRVNMICRTMTTFAICKSQLSVWKDTIWVTQRDGDVRPSHAAMDGKKPDKDGNFHVGNAIGKHPGAMDLEEENINCRCGLYPV